MSLTEECAVVRSGDRARVEAPTTVAMTNMLAFAQEGSRVETCLPLPSILYTEVGEAIAEGGTRLKSHAVRRIRRPSERPHVGGLSLADIPLPPENSCGLARPSRSGVGGGVG